MSTEHSNHYKYMLHTGKVDWSADSFKIILMENGFIFNKDTHATYADLSASELATGNGYTQNTKTLTTVVISEDDTENRSDITCDDVTWTASGGQLGPTPGAVIYDDTTTDNTVVGYLDFGGTVLKEDGHTLDIEIMTIRLA